VAKCCANDGIRAFPVQTDSSDPVGNAKYENLELFIVSVEL